MHLDSSDLVSLAANCDLCSKPVDLADACWLTSRFSGSYSHALCLAAYFLINDSPSRLPYEIANEVNERSDELTDLLCKNPAHAAEH